MQANTVRLAGTIASIDPLRHTPAGLPLARFRLRHDSTQNEAGMSRHVECEVEGVGIGEIAKALAAIQAGSAIEVAGFLSRKGRTGSQLILHVTNIS